MKRMNPIRQNGKRAVRNAVLRAAGPMGNGAVNWRKIWKKGGRQTVLLLFFAAMFLLGRGIGYARYQARAAQASMLESRLSGDDALDAESRLSGDAVMNVETRLSGDAVMNAENRLSGDIALNAENWGLGFGESGTQPTGNSTPAELAAYDAWYVGDGAQNSIYLTFDCGYENGNTPAILDALWKHQAKATFFVVGHYLESAPELVQRMVAEGHTVGNHTWSHPDMSSISTQEAFQSEVDRVAEKFQEVTGQEMVRFYRPPQGKYSTQNLQMAQQLGYRTFFWSLAYVDWNVDSQPTHEQAFEKLIGRIHPGAIVLLHNTSQTNAEILDELLTKWEEMGYCFGTLEELVGGV